MKKLFFITALICLSFIGAAQIADTLYTQKNQKIACKIYEVNEFDVILDVMASDHQVSFSSSQVNTVPLPCLIHTVSHLKIFVKYY